jgi:hypothetical protein
MNESELSRMRQEAIRRMQEMQRRAQGMFGGVGSSAVKEKEDAQAHTESSPSSAGAKELFRLAGIPIDEEKALIGMLIYILYKQGADIKLLLALGYLLL